MNRRPPSTARPLSTSARVHPSFLPYLHNASRSKARGLKWIPPLAAAVTAGYAATTYLAGGEAEQQQLQQQQRQVEAEQQRRREAAMADAYGDRDSLEALERAVRVYEAQRSSGGGR
ncbi:be624aa3-118b-4570-bdf8-cbaf52623467 [Thermothielavioides terrestris]|uniref:Uncharacterized protein n=2 Tax=Thermothielavioides terrestris TaxID=2587410 RepID=G2R0I9_THETT|nr:uncharacterized protein THITE_2114558 [Thermothielavioides terrestris NRRL 8126]AEO66457.1 hypothetical protein THITE_2114558 [Thermothielavioides terrestris NRRL 8126]SPQ20312.1 be624aa3-118b-4570-bdf8-cbaf52623467 [Thermothielavioides terrestris]